MAAITAAPLVLKSVTLTIGTDEYGASGVSSVAFTPSASAINWQGFNGITVRDVNDATWTVGLTFAQDWETANSLSQYLYTNEGETVAMTFEPKSASGPSFTSNVVITPGAIGGAVNSVGTATVTLGCSKPVLVPAI